MTLKLVAASGKPVADLEAETKILGAILYDDRHVAALPAKLTPACFVSGGAHAAIFAAILELRDEREEINPVTVAARLRDRDRLRMLQGGKDYLVDLVNHTPALTPKTFAFLTSSVVNKATQRQLQVLLARAQARADDPDLDVGDELASLERELLGLSLNVQDQSALTHIGDALRAEVNDWHRRATTETAGGISTGFASLDMYAGRLHPGDLIVLGARPGMGKTSLVGSLAMNVAKLGQATAIFSLEMPRGQIAGRMLCTEAGIKIANTRMGRFEGNELTRVQMALSALKELGIYIDDAARGRPFAADIVARCRRLAAELARNGKRLGLVVVDYIQIVQLRPELQRQRHDLAIAEISIELKALAKELETTVVACAQLNRGVEGRPDKRPGLADLRDSGQIEQDADMVWMLYRDEYYNPDSEDAGIVEVIVEKNRHGRPGTVYLRFDGPTVSFADDPRTNYERGMH